MGQQQLLLLVLGVVIVGLAVVVGINAFSENQIRSNADAMVTEGLRMASDIQAYALKPDQFGGGGGWTKTKDNLSDLSELGIDNETVNGNYSIDSDCTGSNTSLTPAPDLAINVDNSENGNEVCIGLTGTASGDIKTDIHYGSGGGSGST